MNTNQRMLVYGLCIVGSAMGGAFLDHNCMQSRVLKAESRLEEMTAKADELVDAQRKEHEHFITQLPNYHNWKVWTGDGLGNCWYDETVGLVDLREHYRD